MPRRTSIFAIGNELTEGKVVDTNSAYISRALRERGFDIVEHLTLPDDHDAMINAFRGAAGRVSWVTPAASTAATTAGATSFASARRSPAPPRSPTAASTRLSIAGTARR